MPPVIEIRPSILNDSIVAHGTSIFGVFIDLKQSNIEVHPHTTFEQLALWQSQDRVRPTSSCGRSSFYQGVLR